MKRLGRWLFNLAAVVSLLLCSAIGCRSHPLMVQEPSLVGEWKGRLHSVDVEDSSGVRIQAVAIEIFSGPRPRYEADDVELQLGGGRLPLLVELHGSDYRIVTAGRVKSLESLAVIRGTMRRILAVVKEDARPGRLVSRLREANGNVGGEHVVVLREWPEVVSEIRAEIAPGRTQVWTSTKP